MIHELRTPMSAILGFAQLLAQEQGLTTLQLERLAIIDKAGKTLLATINDSLSLAKIEAGMVELTPFDFDLNELIQDLIKLLSPGARAKGIGLFLDPTSVFPGWIRTDPVKLRQILVNLVGNSIKCTRQGEVTIWIEVEEPRNPAAARRLRLEVRDTGHGIARQDLARIFDPFVQLHNREGTGLGLSISRQFVKLLGGEIEAESQLGKGTTMRFDIEFDLHP